MSIPSFAVITISLIAYCICFLRFRKNIINLEISFLIIYIFSVLFLRSLDVALPMYFLFSAMPILPGIQAIDKKVFYVCIVFAIYLIYGVLFQNTYASIETFIARFWQFIIIFLVINNRHKFYINIKSNSLIVCAVAETLFAAYLFLTKSGRGLVVRLTAGAQPVCGNVSVAILPLIGYLYFKNRSNLMEQTKILWITLYLGIWIALSGTRGYILVYVISFSWILLDYFFSGDKRNNRIQGSRFVLFICSVIVIFAMIFFNPSFSNKVFTLTRLGKKSTGIRKYENSAMIEFFKNTSIGVELFGIGFGGTAGKHQEFLNAISNQAMKGMWNLRHYIYDSGALFHNLFMNILLTMGLLGFFLITVLLKMTIKKLNFIVKDKKLKRFLLFYLVGFLLMVWYRWSTDCGIASIFFFSAVIQSCMFEKDLKITGGNELGL